MTLRVLTYHSHNISGETYADNDHVALASDLEVLHRLGARITPLEGIASLVRERRVESSDLVVGLSFDDGPVFDVEDFVHERFGPQRSFAGILRDFASRNRVGVAATSFVIASPEARLAMERSPDCGFPHRAGWLSEHWWRPAAGSSILAIGNHSWDHVHHAPESIAAAVSERDNFSLVRDYVSADAEIRRAADYINARVGGLCRVFAFPFGHTNEYLVRDYLPERSSEHGMIAAFGVGPEPITTETSTWNIPRAVCGQHWRSSEELEALLGED